MVAGTFARVADGRTRGCLKLARHLALAAAVSLASVAVVLASATPAAAYNCQGTHGNYFDGDASPPNSLLIGLTADITVRPAVFCSPNYYGNFFSAWEMTADAYAQNYAQSGFIAVVGLTNSAVHFSQYSAPGGPISDFTNIAAQTGYPYHYSTLYSGACSCIQMYVGGLFLDQTYYNPLTVWPQPLQAQAFGEVNNITDGQPGSPFPYTTNWGNVTAQVYGGSQTPFNLTRTENDDGFIWGLNPSHACGPYFSQYCSDVWTN